MEIRICDKCKAVHVKQLLPKLKELFPNASIIIGCQNMCGVGRNKPFVIINDKPIIADSNQKLIEEIIKQKQS